MSKENFHLVKKTEVGYPKKVLVCPLFEGVFKKGANKGGKYFIGRSGLVTYSIVPNVSGHFRAKTTGNTPAYLLSIQQSKASKASSVSSGKVRSDEKDDMDI